MKPSRYRSEDEDSDRWTRFPFRSGDVVVSARSKSGTTWVQHICLSMAHGTAVLPAPLGTLSPWVDWLGEPEDALFARLEAQTVRRVLKTHTPLDGVVLDQRAQFLVVVRDPLDVAVSLYHQGDNLDRDRIAELTGRTRPARSSRPPLNAWLAQWVRADADPMGSMDSLAGVVHHAADAWARRDDHRILVVRYEDLIANLEGQMRWLGDRLDYDVAANVWPSLVSGASFASMRASALQRAPNTGGVIKDPGKFFRSGTPGAGRAILTQDDFATYQQRVYDLLAVEVAEDRPSVLKLLNLDSSGGPTPDL